MVWGNAQLNSSGGIQCQHGPNECLFNTLQSCAVSLNPEPSVWLPFIHCLETHGSTQGKYAEKCAQTFKLDWAALNQCWTGPKGQALDLANYKRTQELKPAHTFVPWATVNGVCHCTDSNCDTILADVCNAYTGTKPAACSSAVAPAVSLRGSSA